MEYFFILLAILLITFYLEKIYKIHLYHNRKERLFAVLIFFVIGVVWDSFAIYRGDWIFPESKNLGIKIGLMPLEEYMFILIIPYSVITIYKIIDSKFSRNKK